MATKIGTIRLNYRTAKHHRQKTKDPETRKFLEQKMEQHRLEMRKAVADNQVNKMLWENE